jgi:hypothetical protein
MKNYIYGLIIFFIFIFVNHLFIIKEGLACLSTKTMIQVNKNTNTIEQEQKKTTGFLDLVTKAENAVAANLKQMQTNMANNKKIYNACCSKGDGDSGGEDKGDAAGAAAGSHQTAATKAAKKQGVTGPPPSKSAYENI